MNVKMLMEMKKYFTTLWFLWGFQYISINDNAQQCPKILLRKKGFQSQNLIWIPQNVMRMRPKWHAMWQCNKCGVRLWFTTNVSVTSAWRNATGTRGGVQQMRLCNECEWQRMRTTGATDAGCNGCGRRVQRMRQLMRRRRWVQRMRTATNAQNGGAQNCALGRGVWVTQIRSGGKESARRGS